MQGDYTFTNHAVVTQANKEYITWKKENRKYHKQFSDLVFLKGKCFFCCCCSIIPKVVPLFSWKETVLSFLTLPCLRPQLSWVLWVVALQIVGSLAANLKWASEGSFWPSQAGRKWNLCKQDISFLTTVSSFLATVYGWRKGHTLGYEIFIVM